MRAESVVQYDKWYEQWREHKWLRPGPLIVLALVGLLLLYTGWLVYVIRGDRSLDFYVYYLAAEIFARGGDAYTISDAEWHALAAQIDVINYTTPYRYPPFTALLVAGLRGFGPRLAAAIWLILSAGAMVAGGWWLSAVRPHRYARALSLFLLLIWVPPLATLLAGQVNALLYLSLVLALYWLDRDHKVAAAVTIAVAVALKVFPLALIGYLGWRRQWRTLLYALIALALLLLCTVPLVGWQGQASYARNALLLSRPDTLFVTPTNQTISGFLGRILPTFAPEAILTAARWSALALVAVTAGACWPVGTMRKYLLYEFGMIMSALQVIAPFTWYHQFLLLHIPLFAVVTHAIQQRHWIILSLWVLLIGLGDLHGLFWRQIQGLYGNGWLLSFPFYVAMTLWLVTGVILIANKWTGIRSS